MTSGKVLRTILFENWKTIQYARNVRKATFYETVNFSRKKELFRKVPANIIRIRILLRKKERRIPNVKQ